MRTNINSARPVIRTHEGAPAKHINPERQLRRSILACLLGEREFYEEGKTIKDRITEFAAQCSTETVAALAYEARQVHGLRHAPLMLLLDLIRRGGPGVAQYIVDTVRRPDDITELLSLYWAKGKRPLSWQLKVGLGKALGKFSEYSLAKYDRDAPVKLRDIMRLTHPKPGEGKAELYGRVVSRTLETPDTWEVELSAGKDKKATFERLIREGNLGYLALLRNLRNMVDAGCDLNLVKEAILARKGAELVFPFRYTAAARAAPSLERYIDKALCMAIDEAPALKGHTIVLVDVSGSMDWKISSKSDITRMDAAATLASVVNSEHLQVFTFSERVVEVPARRGMSGVEAITRSQSHSGTRLGLAVKAINAMKHDRLIVVTDEQSHDPVADPVTKKAYMINVASNKNGVGYGKWIHIDGFSEAVLRYIIEFENGEAAH